MKLFPNSRFWIRNRCLPAAVVILRHAKADTTANEYVQELPESVERMVESMYEELTGGQAAASTDLLPIAMRRYQDCSTASRRQVDRMTSLMKLDSRNWKP